MIRAPRFIQIYWGSQTRFQGFQPPYQREKAINRGAHKQLHQINLGDGYTVTVQPLSSQDYSLPNNKKYALILDTSYSMENYSKEVQETFEWWQENLTNNDVDLYVTDAEAKRAKRLDEINNLDLNKLVFFGSIQTQEMLQQFQLLRKGNNYDAVLLVTDEGSYELSEDNQDIPLVYNLSQQDDNQLSLAKLDSIHQIAKDYDIVTPYSSMIVLVNDRQRELLKQAETKSDRFDREVEKGTEQLNTPFTPFEVPTVSGVPEPDLWILLGIVEIALYLVFQRQRAADI